MKIDVRFHVFYLLVLWQVVHGKEYQVSRDTKSFNSAVDFCDSLDMKIVSIKDRETNNLVSDFAKEKGLKSFWINANDREKEGWFVDTDNKPVTYTNWAENQPNNLLLLQNCVGVDDPSDGLWDDDNCYAWKYAICEHPESPNTLSQTGKDKDTEHVDKEKPIEYHVVSTKLSFADAVEYCKKENMELVKIKDKETNDIVLDFATKNKLGNYWINGNDIANEGVYVNTDNEKLTYLNWHFDQPDNTDNEDCIHVYYKYGLWNDLKCSSNLDVICQTIKEVEKPLTEINKNEEMGQGDSESSNYYFAKSKMTFDNARLFCKDKKMELVKVENKEDDKKVNDFARKYKLGSYWIDGNDRENEGHFVNSNNVPLNYTNWGWLEPNNFFWNQDCIHVLDWTDGHWNDIKCSSYFSVICYRASS